jgi:colanic acid biosynthesis protein WcaH
VLRTADFRRVVAHAPLVSIDIVIVNPRGEVLLGLRRNQPARGRWFVPGGRILKGERIARAFTRILKQEIGTAPAFRRARFLGVFEHIYRSNAFGEPGYGTHYVVLAYKVKLAAPRLRADPQHADLRWWKVADIRASRAVHANTRAYFRR